MQKDSKIGGYDLTANQIAWLSANIPSFKRSWTSAEAVRREMEDNRREMTPVVVAPRRKRERAEG